MRPLLRLLLAATAYFVAARLGYAFKIPGGSATLWPPAGVMLALLLLSKRRDWPDLLAGALVGSFLSDRLTGFSVPLAIAAALANATETLVAAWFVRWQLGETVRLTTLRAVITVTLGAAVVTNFLTSFLGAAMLHGGGIMSFWTGWIVWWAGDGLGMLVITPVVLEWAAVIRARRPVLLNSLLEGVALILLLAIAAQLALGPRQGWTIQAAPYMTLPLLIGIALRFGPVGAATGGLVLAAIATWNAALGAGPFVAATVTRINSAVQVYAFLAVAVVSALIPAAVLEERKAARDDAESRATWLARLQQLTMALSSAVTVEQVVAVATHDARAAFGADDALLRMRDETTGVVDHPGEPERDAMTVPIHVGGESLGVLVLVRPRRTEPNAVVLATAHAFGTELGQAFERTRTRAALDAARVGAEAASQAKSGFLATISHELRTPINAILGFTELLQMGLAGALEPKQKAYVDRVRNSTEHLLRLVGDLLDIAKIEAGQLLVQTETARAVHVVRDTVIQVQESAAAQGLTLETSCDPSVTYFGDPLRVRQILLNLVTNAVKFTPKGGRVSVACAYARDDGDPPCTTFTVTDSGMGIAEEHLERVFDAFIQLDRTRTTSHRGAGLGLAISRRLARMMKGDLTVRSVVGEGSTFTLVLPADAPVSPSADDVKIGATPAAF